MAFGKFQTLEEVLIKFDIEMKTINFLDTTNFVIVDTLSDFLQQNLSNRLNYINENSICETIISPILNVVSIKHNLPVWSHVRFDVSEAEGLTGTPDFLIAPVSKTGVNFTNPIVCIAEVKKENFEEGWAQALSEMITAQKFNNTTEKPIYGIATSGEIWKVNQ
jgi:hypothetical protein